MEFFTVSPTMLSTSFSSFVYASLGWGFVSWFGAIFIASRILGNTWTRKPSYQYRMRSDCCDARLGSQVAELFVIRVEFAGPFSVVNVSPSLPQVASSIPSGENKNQDTSAADPALWNLPPPQSRRTAIRQIHCGICHPAFNRRNHIIETELGCLIPKH